MKTFKSIENVERLVSSHHAYATVKELVEQEMDGNTWPGGFHLISYLQIYRKT